MQAKAHRNNTNERLKKEPREHAFLIKKKSKNTNIKMRLHHDDDDSLQESA